MVRLLAFLTTMACAAAYSPSVNRRQAFQTLATGIVVGAPAIANALDACSPKANNCVFTKWTPPDGTSKSNAVKDLRSVIESYPQEGQAVSYCCLYKNLLKSCAIHTPCAKGASQIMAILIYFTLSQQEVDGGGWSIASDDLDSAGTARIEYRSSGKGFFAKTFNG